MGKKVKQCNQPINRQHQSRQQRSEEKRKLRGDLPSLQRHRSPLDRDSGGLNIHNVRHLMFIGAIGCVAGAAFAAAAVPQAQAGSEVSNPRRRGSGGSHLVPLIEQKQGGRSTGSVSAENNGRRRVRKERKVETENDDAPTYDLKQKLHDEFFDEELVKNAEIERKFNELLLKNDDSWQKEIYGYIEKLTHNARDLGKKLLDEILAMKGEGLRETYKNDKEKLALYIRNNFEEYGNKIKLKFKKELIAKHLTGEKSKEKEMTYLDEYAETLNNIYKEVLIESKEVEFNEAGELKEIVSPATVQHSDERYSKVSKTWSAEAKHKVDDQIKKMRTMVDGFKDRYLQTIDPDDMADFKATYRENPSLIEDKVSKKCEQFLKKAEYDYISSIIGVVESDFGASLLEINEEKILTDIRNKLFVVEDEFDMEFFKEKLIEATKFHKEFHQFFQQLDSKTQQAIKFVINKAMVDVKINRAKFIAEVVSMRGKGLKDDYKNNEKKLTRYIEAAFNNYKNKIVVEQKRQIMEVQKNRIKDVTLKQLELTKLDQDEYVATVNQIYAEIMVEPKVVEFDSKTLGLRDKQLNKELLDEGFAKNAQIEANFDQLILRLTAEGQQSLLKSIDTIVDASENLKADLLNKILKDENDLVKRKDLKEEYNNDEAKLVSYVSNKMDKYKKKLIIKYKRQTSEKIKKGLTPKADVNFDGEYVAVVNDIYKEILVVPIEVEIDPKTRIIQIKKSIDPIAGKIVETNLDKGAAENGYLVAIGIAIAAVAVIVGGTYSYRKSSSKQNVDTDAKENIDEKNINAKLQRPRGTKNKTSKKSRKPRIRNITTSTAAISYEDSEKKRLIDMFKEKNAELNKKRKEIQSDHDGKETKLRKDAKYMIDHVVYTDTDKAAKSSVANLKRFESDDPYNLYDSKVKEIDDKIKKCEDALSVDDFKQCEASIKDANSTITKYQKEMETRHKVIQDNLKKLSAFPINPFKSNQPYGDETSPPPLTDNTTATPKDNPKKTKRNNQPVQSLSDITDILHDESAVPLEKEEQSAVDEGREKELEPDRERLNMLLTKRGQAYRKRGNEQEDVVLPTTPVGTLYLGPSINTYKESLSSKIDNLFELITNYFDKFFPKEETNKPSLERTIGRGTFFYFIIKLCENCHKHNKNETIANLRGLICHDHRQLSDDNAVYDFATLFKNEYENLIEKEGKNLRTQIQDVVLRCSKAILATIEQSEFILNAINDYAIKRQSRRHRFHQAQVADFFTPRMNVMKDIILLVDLYKEKIMPHFTQKGNLATALEQITVVDPAVYYTCEFILQSISESLTKVGFNIEEGYLISLRNCVDHALGALSIEHMDYFLGTMLPRLILFLRENGIELETDNINVFMDVQELRNSRLEL